MKDYIFVGLAIVLVLSMVSVPIYILVGIWFGWSAILGKLLGTSAVFFTVLLFFADEMLEHSCTKLSARLDERKRNKYEG